MSAEASPPDTPRPGPGAFRWQALFQQTADPLFVLDGRRRVRFVNRAFEALTTLPAESARGLVCRRPRPVGPAEGLEEVLAHALTPPPEALQGQFGKVRRLLPARGPLPAACWDVEFFPLAQGPDRAPFFLGRIKPVSAAVPDVPLLPEKLVALRERAVRPFGLDWLDSGLPAMRRLAQQVRLASEVRAPVFLVGEAGTGKESLARVIHYQGPRRERAFVALDCARLPPAALARALFAEGTEERFLPGAIYLREPGRLPRDLQLRLHEWLIEGAAHGADVPRLLAGSRSPLAEAQLIDGLACALGALVLEVPALRERKDDLRALAERLLARSQGEGPAVSLTPAAWGVLHNHPWPGNVRELHAVLRGARAHAGGGTIDVVDLPAAMRQAQRVEQEAAARPAPRPIALPEVLEQVERRLIELALRRAGGNKTRAAELLSMWRPKLQRRIEALKIEGASPGEPEA